MKLKDGIDVWGAFEEALKPKENWWGGWNKENPLNKILELEDNDFITAIEICKQFKKYNVKQEVEADYRLWKSGNFDEESSKWILKFRSNITRARKYKSTANEIDNEVKSRFKKDFILISKFSKLADLFRDYPRDEKDYLRAKERYEKATTHMNTFLELKNSGLSPEEFLWDLIEPKVEEQQ